MCDILLECKRWALIVRCIVDIGMCLVGVALGLGCLNSWVWIAHCAHEHYWVIIDFVKEELPVLSKIIVTIPFKISESGDAVSVANIALTSVLVKKLPNVRYSKTFEMLFITSLRVPYHPNLRCWVHLRFLMGFWLICTHEWPKM